MLKTLATLGVVGVLSLVAVSSATATTISFSLGTGTAQFSAGLLQQGASTTFTAPTGFSVGATNYTITGGTETFTSGATDTLTIKGGVTGFGDIAAGTTLLQISWTPAVADITSQSGNAFTYLYSGQTYLFSSNLLNDLGIAILAAGSGDGFTTSSCATTCSGTGATTTGVYNVNSQPVSYLVTATPEPATFGMVGFAALALLITGRKRFSLRIRTVKG